VFASSFASWRFGRTAPLCIKVHCPAPCDDGRDANDAKFAGPRTAWNQSRPFHSETKSTAGQIVLSLSHSTHSGFASFASFASCQPAIGCRPVPIAANTSVANDANHSANDANALRNDAKPGEHEMTDVNHRMERPTTTPVRRLATIEANHD